MSDADILDRLTTDHRELAGAVTRLSNQITKVDGKIDKALAILEEQGRRHGRSEDRLDRVEVDLRKEVRRIEDDHKRQIKEVDDKVARNTRWTAMAGGGFAVIVFIIPIIVKFLGFK